MKKYITLFLLAMAVKFQLVAQTTFTDVNITGVFKMYGPTMIYNTSGRPTLTLKNDDGETANPADGGLVAGSANGGAILFGNNFTYTGINYRYLKLGMVDNNGTFNSAINIPAETLNVGIGTANPHEKLSVNGTVLATKVRVSVQASDWSDYVFGNNYYLRSFKSLESFINKNKHLPNVPTAKQVEKNGLDVGANQALLLGKIEELTLYIIKLNKEVEKLKRGSKKRN